VNAKTKPYFAPWLVQSAPDLSSREHVRTPATNRVVVRGALTFARDDASTPPRS